MFTVRIAESRLLRLVLGLGLVLGFVLGLELGLVLGLVLVVGLGLVNVDVPTHLTIPPSTC